MSDILFNKIRNVKSPSSAYGFAAATDFYIPEYDPIFYNDLMNKAPNRDYCDCSISPNRDSMTITIAPHGRVNIPSGIRVIITDQSTCMLAVNKSGIAANKSLVCGACLVDADYRGEVHLNLINVSDEPVTLKTGDKVVQFMHLPVIKTDYVEISADMFDAAPKTERGTGGFGSSNTH